MSFFIVALAAVVGGTVVTVVAMVALFVRRGQPAHCVHILVLGDVGRSPRMQYHALSLARHNVIVHLIGYAGSQCHAQLLRHPRITLNLMKPLAWRPEFLARSRILFVVYAAIKVAYQLVQLFFVLVIATPTPSFLLVQNPPAIPSLLVAHIVTWIRRSRLVIDWHNFGFTILGMSLGKSHPLVRIARMYERILGRGAYGNFCVTRAMQTCLREEWNVRAQVLYDRPPAFFRPRTLAEKHNLFLRLESKDFLHNVVWPAHWSPNERLSAGHERTIVTDGPDKVRADRPALVISSTSWTEDEDFSILLDAVRKIELHARKCNEAHDGTITRSFPKVLFFITGKGPQREFYDNQIGVMNLRWTRVITAWLAAEDYPRLLGCSDVGVSLHTSSSGLDLPMKVVDMFGSGLPVCAIGFSCLDELVQHDRNGTVFQTSSQLAHQLIELLSEFPHSTPKLDTYREAIRHFQALRWDQCWDEHAWPVFDTRNDARNDARRR